MKKKILIIILGAVCLNMGMTSCRSTSNASFYAGETECLGVERDGSQTLRAWGTGRDKGDAVEQAKKNAVYDVLFKGIRSGSPECNLRPLVLEVNAHEKYEDYFNAFFRDKGPYKQFVNQKDEKTNSKQAMSNQTQIKYGVTVRVLRAELKERLIRDGILK